MRHYDVIIVGSGHGGAQAAIALRQFGFPGSIAIVSEEADLPYERPPLSKEYLSGEKPFERMLIRPPDFWAARAVELQLGSRVVAVRAETRTLELAGGETLGYGNLVWAAGGYPHRLRCEGADLAGVHVIRRKSDVDALRRELAYADRVAIVGGGYVGLEAAAMLTKVGKKVTLVEAADRVLSRVAAEPLSRFYEAEHRAQRVDLRTGDAVELIEGRGASSGVRLASGESIPAQIVVVAIGIGAAVEPLMEAGADASDGVEVDEYCRTSLANIYAVGDCARHANRFAAGARLRLESVQNATDQATSAARAIAGMPQPYSAVPWFWSNQYDLRLQTVGLWRGFDALVVRGEPSARSFSVLYLRDRRLVAADCVNATRDYAQARKIITENLPLRTESLADADTPLKDMVRS